MDTNVQFPDELISEKVILQKPKADFKTATMVYACIDKNRDMLRPWLPWVDKTTAPEDTFCFLKETCSRFKENTACDYFVIERATGDFCGLCGIYIRRTSLSEYAKIGYWLDKDKQGHGYIGESVRLLEKMIFSQNIMRLIIQNDTANTSSARVAQRAGFQLESVMRAAHYSDYFKNYRNKNIWVKLNPLLSRQYE